MIKRIEWNMHDSVTFTGRNGTFFCTGVYLELLGLGTPESVRRLTIMPVTSKGRAGRCDIDIPVDKLDELITALTSLKVQSDIDSKLEIPNEIHN
jgi:hypothetical protein